MQEPTCWEAGDIGTIRSVASLPHAPRYKFGDYNTTLFHQKPTSVAYLISYNLLEVLDIDNIRLPHGVQGLGASFDMALQFGVFFVLRGRSRPSGGMSDVKTNISRRHTGHIFLQCTVLRVILMLRKRALRNPVRELRENTQS